MSTLIKKRSPEEVAAFFKKNKWSIERLLGDVTPKKKKKKTTKRKKKTAPKKKEVVEEEVTPTVEETAPVVEEIVMPVVEEVAAPVVEEMVMPVVEEVAAPVIDVEEETPVETKVDDLTKLDGLGAKMAESLAAVGITTYADLAALTKKKAEKVGEGIRGFLSKFEKKKWRQQAKEFMKG